MRNDNSPGEWPKTEGLEISEDGGDTWAPFLSGASPYSGTDWVLMRINPKLFDNQNRRPALLQLNPSAALGYSSHRADGSNARGEAPIAASEYTPIWVDYRKGATFAVQPDAGADTLSYLLYYRRMSPDEKNRS